jgi:hypothetical protein
MISRRTSSVPKEEVVFPDCSTVIRGASRRSQVRLKGTISVQLTLSRRLDDGQRVILHQRVRGSVRAVRAVRNTRLFLTETRVVADEMYCQHSQVHQKATVLVKSTFGFDHSGILVRQFSKSPRGKITSYWYISNFITSMSIKGALIIGNGITV